MIVGYARVSSDEQRFDLQLDALKRAGCEKVYQERGGGTKKRAILEEALASLKAGDTLVVWKLDRLGRSLLDLLRILEDLDRRTVAFKSLSEDFDTQTPGGRMLFQIFGSVAEYERALISSRTNEGLASAKARGRVGGRPKKVTEPWKISWIKELYEEGVQSIDQICSAFQISRATLYRIVKS